MTNTKITANQLVSSSKKDYLLAVLTDANNKPVANADIQFKDDQTTYVKTDNDGKARYFFNKGWGAYNVKVSFKGNNNYSASETSYTIKKGNLLTKQEITDIARKVKNHVETHYSQPSEINGVRHGEFTYLFCKLIIACTIKNIGRQGVGTAEKPFGDTVHDAKVWRSAYLDMCRRVIKYVDEHHQLPNYVTWEKGQRRIHMWLFEYGVAKIITYMADHQNEEPSYVMLDSNAFVKPKPPEPEPKSYSEEILDYFSDRFGRPDSIDDALEKIQDNGYGYYYDDRYSNKESINRMKNGQGVNCTDSCHVFWHIGKALGYEVRAIHIMCRGGDGHIRLQFKNSKNDWFNRDPAAVLDGECVECIWCSNGTYLATNPQWFLNNLNR